MAGRDFSLQIYHIDADTFTMAENIFNSKELATTLVFQNYLYVVRSGKVLKINPDNY